MVNRATALETLYRRGAYVPLTQESYVSLVCDALALLPPTTIIQRLTGDPRPEELVAPAWTLRKQETLSRIHQELDRRKTVNRKQ